MEFVSIFNDVLGPVMHGPSSSHTAASYRIGRMAHSLLGDEPSSVTFIFDPEGSYAKVFRQQGADLAFAAGLMGWQITDDRFHQALEIASGQDLKIKFKVESLDMADHPNTVLIQMTSRKGKELSAVAKSIGGGGVIFTRIEDFPVELSGKTYEISVLSDKESEPLVEKLLMSGSQMSGKSQRQEKGDLVFLHIKRFSALDAEVRKTIETLPGVKNIWISDPVFFVTQGDPLFSSAQEMVALAENRSCSLGQIALDYESELLKLTKDEVIREMIRRFEIMQSAVRQGLSEKNVQMQLLSPSARQIREVESQGKVAIGGIHTRAAANAMAALHVSNSMGIVCAAPTGGASGVIPGVVVTLAEEKKMDLEEAAMALFASSAVGLIIAERATFAAEIAGCQVEIGAASAMAAAAVIEIAGGTAQQAVDAAAISLQNSMGSVCDLVQGICEIPCHTRNAVAASSAFVCADLVLGGYSNPVPLDETVDAVYATGKMLPPELRCTSLGGIAVTPSALSMPRQKK